MPATLYSVYTSHPSHAARLMLEHKGIEHRVVDLVPGAHRALVRLLGFRLGTVPALRIEGIRVQGTLAISRALDRVQPEPALFPAEPEERAKVEEAEAWAEEHLQPVPRRIGGWIIANRPAMQLRIAREAGLPAPGLLAVAGRPLARLNARRVGAGDGGPVREAIAALPLLLDHVDELIGIGTIGRQPPNAADFQVGTTIRLLMSFGDLAPAISGRRAAEFATRLMPSYPTALPAGLLPGELLEPLRG